MRLTHIKLAGFKSFVDPTHIPLPGRLIGVSRCLLKLTAKISQGQTLTIRWRPVMFMGRNKIVIVFHGIVYQFIQIRVTFLRYPFNMLAYKTP